MIRVPITGWMRTKRFQGLPVAKAAVEDVARLRAAHAIGCLARVEAPTRAVRGPLAYITLLDSVDGLVGFAADPWRAPGEFFIPPTWCGGDVILFEETESP